ncbi:hypothetical protein KPH14_008127 [Odynerus spinipes]|uniref:tRNA-splicing endonuclease subunit Sen54 N-terminal domain-containing protein n=1 Tax=Odynerus spinipes TaxID=1348599 RepID=A0AAD9RLK9_9HYME|nr:hypothetical protein KPH14_008127 [Odynerus spinipes]
MNEGEKILPENMLTAEQLIQSKGIKCNAWDEWEQSRKVLPKFGQKQFEPNNSWLEKVQIEKGIKNIRDLLNIERVERISQLAIAEWLPDKKKAQVVKKSGQDWGNFGTEINNILYLIPEEALLLLEMNCLELLWNGMPLSIQQAYEILIDDTECTLEEYRVYSQLTRYGYHIQRFHYRDTIRDTVSDESGLLKRKVIVEPEKGLRMGDSQQRMTNDINSQSEVSNNIKKDLSKQQTNTNTGKSIQFSSDTVEEDIQQIIEDVMNTVESTTDVTLLISKYYDTKLKNETATLRNKQFKLDAIPKEVVEKDGNSQNNRNSKIDIIFEKMVSTNIQVIKEPISCSTKNGAPIPKWLDSRIQRNVKLLPRRTEKLSIINNKFESTNYLEQNNSHKKKESLSCGDETENKKLKMEVIELSDDEIQIVPHTMTRTEMLDLLPNIASQAVIIQKISQDYIPHTIKPYKNIYRYETNRLQHLPEIDSKMRCKYSNRNLKEMPHSSTSNLQTDGKAVQRNCLIPFHNQNINKNIYGIMSRALCNMQLSQYSRFGSFQYPSNRFPFYHQAYGYNRGAIIQQNLYLNNSHAFSFGYSGNFGPFGNTMPQNGLVDVGVRMTRSERNEYQSSFRVLPDVTSWKELKKKWHDERTITIDDEDCTNRENLESSEVEILKEHIPPLVGPNNVANLAEVFNKLKIIKNAPEKTVRRRRGEFKISYNVYSNTQHYRKGNPGEPLYRLVVIRQKENPFFQPVELNRLQQDAKGIAIMFAIVSMSISYIRPGIVSIPLLS